MDLLPDDLYTSALEIPKSKILKISEEELPKNWNHYPSPDVFKKALVKAGLSWGIFHARNPKRSESYGIKLSHQCEASFDGKNQDYRSNYFRIDNRLSKY